MNYIITLVLNEIGKRAVGQNTKKFQVDADIADITSENISTSYSQSHWLRISIVYQVSLT